MTGSLQLLSVAFAGSGAALGAFFAVALASRRLAQPANRHLAAFCACFAVLMAWDISIAVFDDAHGAWVFLLLPPLFYAYVRELATGGRLPPRVSAAGLLPAAVSLAWFCWQLAAGPPRAATEDFMPPAYTLSYFVVACAQLLGYCVAAQRLIRMRAGAAEDRYSTLRGVDLRWLNRVMLGAGVAVVVWLVTALVASPLFDTLGAALPLCVVLALGVLAQEQRPFQPAPSRLPEAAPERSAPPPKYAKSGLTPERLHALADVLAAFMLQEKAYLESDLTLDVLATRTDMPAHQLSQVLNQALGMSFFEYTNRLRVREAQRCLADPAFDVQGVLDIGLAAGFNSKAAYHAAFKRFSDTTPSRYRVEARAERGTPVGAVPDNGRNTSIET